jgi:hypothetical protein
MQAVSCRDRGSAGLKAVHLAVVLLLPQAACGDAGRDASTQRDSAGVSIVESVRPIEVDAWRLDDSAAVRIPGDGSDAAERPVSVAADRSDRILVADAGSGGGSILAYDADGRFLFRAAGAGGPASLGELWWAAPYQGDSIVAFDITGRRLVVFDPQGAFARELAIPFWRPQGPYGLPNYAAAALGPMADGQFLTAPAGVVELPDSIPGPAWFQHDLLRVAPDGQTWDTLGAFEIFQTWVGETSIQPYPYGSVASAAPHPEGFVTTDGETFEIRAFDPEGALRRILRRAHSPATVNEADLALYRGWYLQRARASPEMNAAAESLLVAQLDSAHHPERRPAVSQLLVAPDGHIWAEEFRWVDAAELAPDPRPATWSVFAPDGRWLAQVQVPARFLVSSVGEDRVYGFLVDEQGRRSVVAYPIVRD